VATREVVDSTLVGVCTGRNASDALIDRNSAAHTRVTVVVVFLSAWPVVVASGSGRHSGCFSNTSSQDVVVNQPLDW
jgi:hypothetical protein